MHRIFNTLNKKLISIFLMLSILPLVITVLIITYYTNQGFSQLIETKQKDMENTVQAQFDKTAQELLDITTIYAEHDELIQAFQFGEREELEKELRQVYPRLEEEHHLGVFEFGDGSGVVFMRGHSPEKYGDDKSEIPAIQAALNGEAVTGFEFGSSGLGVRAFSPVIHQDEVIGTLQTGVDGAFLEDLKEMLQGTTIDLYNGEGEVVVSSTKDHIGRLIEDPSLLTSVKAGEVVSSNDRENMKSYMPLYDPTKSQIIGVIGMTQDVSAIKETQEKITWIVLLICVITLLVVFSISFILSRSISNPIKQTARSMVELSKGNLNLEVKESRRDDEVGQLVNAMAVLKGNLHQIFEKTTFVSTSVSEQSEELSHSANEVKMGSEQIAVTMQEIAAGTEKQTDHIIKLSSTMDAFTKTIQETEEKGEQIHTSSQEVLKLTNNGMQLMESSNQQMLIIDQIVQEAVRKMDNLDHQAKEVSRIVLMIHEVADQTNLLALNAAIEAARAGEHGRGFAVVADEVRQLAQQVSESVTEITEIVNRIQNESSMTAGSLKNGYKEVEKGSNQIQNTGETFNQIRSAVSEMAQEMKSISEKLSGVAVTSQELNATSEVIARIAEESAAGVEETAATTQQSSSSMEEVSQSSRKLATLAEELQELVRYFKLS